MKVTSARWQTEISADGVRYLLPYRQLGKARHVGWIIAAMGLFGTLFMITWMSLPIMEGMRMLARQHWLGLGFVGFELLGLFGLVPSLGILLVGLAAVTNRTRCTLAIRDGTLFSTERFFLFRWRRKCPTSHVQRLRLITQSEKQGFSEGTSRLLGEATCGLVAACDGRKDFAVALGYPHELLSKLAEELAPRIEAELDLEGFYKSESIVSERASSSRSIDVVYATEEYDEEESSDATTVPSKPVDSDATIERREDGVTVRLPPVGVWRGSKGLLLFSLFWNGLIGAFAVMLVLSLFGIVKAEGKTSPVFMLLFLIPFVMVGAGTLLAAINMGKRHCVIATAFDSLMVIHHSIFRKQVRQWTIDQLAAIRVGPSGMAVNDVPIMELQIHPKTGNKYGVLSERQDDELEWIAGELNQSLGLSTRLDERNRSRDSVHNTRPSCGTACALSHVLLLFLCNAFPCPIPSPQPLAGECKTGE